METVLNDFSPSALAAAAKSSLYHLFAHFERSEHAATRRGAGWCAWRSGLAYAWFNGVLVDRRAEQVAGAEIEEALRLFAGYDGEISWWLAPHVAVDPWRELLASRGLQYEAKTPGMAIDLNTLSELHAGAAAVPGLEIRAMTSAEAMREWSAIFTTGYGLPDDWLEGVYNLSCTVGWELPVRNYLALLDGEPVATSTLLPGAGVAGVYNVATLPAARGRGIGAAITLAALEHGRSLGYRIGVLQSSGQGFSVYRRMGFVEVCKIDLFVGRVPDG